MTSPADPLERSRPSQTHSDSSPMGLGQGKWDTAVLRECAGLRPRPDGAAGEPRTPTRPRPGAHSRGAAWPGEGQVETHRDTHITAQATSRHLAPTRSSDGRPPASFLAGSKPTPGPVAAELATATPGEERQVSGRPRAYRAPEDGPCTLGHCAAHRPPPPPPAGSSFQTPPGTTPPRPG